MNDDINETCGTTRNIQEYPETSKGTSENLEMHIKKKGIETAQRSERKATTKTEDIKGQDYKENKGWCNF